MRFLLLPLLLILAALPVRAAGIHHDLDVVLDPAARRLEVTDRITVPPGRQRFLLDAGLEVLEAGVPHRRNGEMLTLEVPDGGGPVTVRYAGTLPGFADESAGGPRADEEGALLAGGWLPVQPGTVPTWRLSVRVPAPHVAVATGHLVEEVRDAAGYRAVFAEDRTVEEPSLFAGPWEVRERRHGDLRLRTYFHPEQAGLSDAFLDQTAATIDRFAARIGPYPFDGFAIVSAPLPVGYGFPALTYIGRRVLPLPFVRGQSLDHEILHTWWGNGVRVGDGGNWAEGLTTYMADHAAAGAEGRDAALRLDWLRDYAALPADRDAPLTAFRAKVHDAAQVVGYGKAAFLFHMLRAEIGDAAFDDGLRRFWEAHRFTAAGWSDLQTAFEAASGRSLDPFFRQWLERTGAPELQLVDATATANGVRVSLRQRTPVYALSVPVAVETDGGTERHTVRLDGREVTADLPSAQRVRAVAVDPDADLFRRLAHGEAPPILRDVTLDRGSAVVVAATDAAAEAARALAARLMDGEPRLVTPGRVDPARPLALIGTTAAIEPLLTAFRLGPPPDAVAGRGTARVWTARSPEGRGILVIAADDAESLAALQRPLPHYGRQSWLVFDGGRAVDRGVWPATGSALRRTID
ncbi:M1 family metallopeptidase [Azospirillum halopraeferens]|uniref:M1 family metallopeptidase n=1 Tax=Azospirillum halopraeferens TaxID=34010 RepID=UPI0005513A32|nr:M1 family aminopeptidase [Azospirillum halopraeferens]